VGWKTHNIFDIWPGGISRSRTTPALFPGGAGACKWAADSGLLKPVKFRETNADVSSGERMTVAVPVAEVATGGGSVAPLSGAMNVRCATGRPSLSNSLTLKSTLVRFVPEARKTAVPLVISASSAALIVTFLNVAKSVGVKVTVPGRTTFKSASPDTRATVTVTLLAGADANLNPICAESFSIATSGGLTRFVRIWIGVSLSTSVAVTSAFVRPAPDARKTADPFVRSASSAALIVTFWNVPKLAGVNVNVAPALTVKSVSPDNRATFTVTLFAGAEANLTPNCAEAPSLTFSVVTLVWITMGSLSTSLTLTSALVRFVPEARKTAVPFAVSASSAALIVTFWNVPKLAGVNVNVAPPLTDRSVSPDSRATFTVTLLAGADDSLTPNCAEPPSLTFSVVTLVWITGPPPPPPHDWPLSVSPVGAGWPVDQLALNPKLTLPPVGIFAL